MEREREREPAFICLITTVGHIKKVDGFYGCYRGLTPKLTGSILSMILSERVAAKLGLAFREDKDESELSEEEK